MLVYEACTAAGPSHCSLYEATPDQVQARIQKLLESVQLSPLPVYNSTDPSNILSGVVDFPLVYLQLFQMLYQPYDLAPTTFQALQELELGNTEPIFMGSVQAANDQSATCQVDATKPFVAGFLDVSAPIACGDIILEGDRERSQGEAKSDYQLMLDASPFATTWYPLSAGRCA